MAFSQIATLKEIKEKAERPMIGQTVRTTSISKKGVSVEKTTSISANGVEIGAGVLGVALAYWIINDGPSKFAKALTDGVIEPLTDASALTVPGGSSSPGAASAWFRFFNWAANA